MRAKYLVALGAMAAAIPLSAAAERAFTVRDVQVFAGPSSEYPPIAQLPPNTLVNVAGCLSDWSWCDVAFGNDRGWVYAADIAVAYEGRRVVIFEYGPRIHLPVVTFSLTTYWDQHYRARPFYGERQQWVSRVHVEANHVGRAPAGHERTAQGGASVQGGVSAQSRTNVQVQQGQPQQQAPTGKARTERSAENEKMRTGKSADVSKPQTAQPAETAKARTEQSRPAESPRASKETQQPQGQRPNIAQSQRPEQAQSREQRMQPQSVQGEQHAKPSLKAEPSPKAEQEPPKGEANAKGQTEQHPQLSRAETSPKAEQQPAKSHAEDQEHPKKESAQQ